MNVEPFEIDAPIRQFFVGRDWEIDLLQREFLGTTGKTVCISGLAGIGKTSLALMFAEMNRPAFPGGVFSVEATPLEPIDKTADHDVRRNTKPYLIIVDDLDVRPQDQVARELAALRRRHPNARVLATSRYTQPPGSVDLQMTLGPLSQAEFRELLEKRFAYVGQSQFADELYSALMGHPLAASLAIGLLKAGGITPRELLERLQAFAFPGIVDTQGQEIPESAPEHKRIRADIVSVSDDFLRKLHDNPKLLYELTSRGFEELVAELLARLEYEVLLTPASKDGGKDIYAAKKDHLGTFLYIVECKKYAPGHPVGVGLVRQLNGVVQAEQATAGILATTSFFTRGAQEFQKTIAFQISLKDYCGIQKWLHVVLSKK